MNNSRADGIVGGGNYAEIIKNTVPSPVGCYFNAVGNADGPYAGYFVFHEFMAAISKWCSIFMELLTP